MSTRTHEKTFWPRYNRKVTTVPCGRSKELLKSATYLFFDINFSSGLCPETNVTLIAILEMGRFQMRHFEKPRFPCSDILRLDLTYLWQNCKNLQCQKWVWSNLRSSEHGKWAFSKCPVSKGQLRLQLPMGLVVSNIKCNDAELLVNVVFKKLRSKVN